MEWARSCGVSPEAFRQIVVNSAEEFKGRANMKEGGRVGLPRWMQSTDYGLTQRERATRLARLHGLRHAAESLWRNVLGEDGVDSAREKMEELITLDSVSKEIFKAIPTSWHHKLRLRDKFGGDKSNIAGI